MPSRVQQIETIQAFLQDVKALKKKHVSWKKMLPSIQAIVDGDDQLLSTKYGAIAVFVGVGSSLSC